MIGLKQKPRKENNKRKEKLAENAITDVENEKVDTVKSKNDVSDEKAVSAIQRIKNTVLTYSVKEDYDFIRLIKDLVPTGANPVILQNSSFSPFNFTPILHFLDAETDTLPSDYVPNKGKDIVDESNDLEVKIL